MHATPLPPQPRRTIVVRRHGGSAHEQRFLSSVTRRAHHGDVPAVDWLAQAQLAVVLSAIAVIVAVGLASIVPAPAIVLGMTAVSAVVGWRRLEPLPQSPRRGPLTHR